MKNDTLNRQYVTVSGNIGSGKSTLVKYLSQAYRATAFYESNNNNPYLNKFYENMKSWGFHSQLYFLIYKYKTCNEIKNHTNMTILDRSLYEDAEIFAKILFKAKEIAPEDFQMYSMLYENIKMNISPPILMVYLKCSINSIYNRIEKRRRFEEQAISFSYLSMLQKLYGNWACTYQHSRIFLIDTDKFNYASNINDRLYLIKTIYSILNTMICRKQLVL